MINIYKITSPQIDKVYIGSTKKKLGKRFAHHKYSLNCSSKSILEYDDVKIELIETVEIDQRLIRERYWIEFYGDKCVNERIPSRTRKEYYEENIDKIKEHQKEIITCECGGKFTRTNLSQHRKSKKHLNFISTQ
jgi:hypothetical protein